MYRKDSDGWLKHADFMLLDMICLQLSFILAYALRGMEMDLYSDVLYRNMAVFLWPYRPGSDLHSRHHEKCIEKRILQRICSNYETVCHSRRAGNHLSVCDSGRTELFQADPFYHCDYLSVFFPHTVREIWKNSLHRKMKTVATRSF